MKENRSRKDSAVLKPETEPNARSDSHSRTLAHALTPYESARIAEIVEWKSQPVNPIAEAWDLIALQAAKAVTFLIPDRLVEYAVELSYVAAQKLSPPRSLARRPGVSQSEDLRERSLDACDAQAKQVMITARVLAAVEGVVTGAGGPWTTLIDVPLLFGSALRTIIRIGQCYGYPADQPEDRYFILGILTVATAGSLTTRNERLERLCDLEKLLVEEIQVDILRSELLSFLFQLEVFEEIPGIGIVSGGLLNLIFMNKVAVASRRVFQERWLRDNGKIDSIAMAPASALHLVPGWTGLVGRATYSLSYHLSFATLLPVFAIASVVKRPFTMANASFTY